MGRLYDRQDLRWNTEWWNKQEQRMHAAIANGDLPFNFLDEVITETRQHTGLPCSRSCGCKSYRWRDKYERERKREQGKFLKTCTLLQDLHAAEATFKACPRCHYEVHATKTYAIECDLHRPRLASIKNDIWWAGDHNIKEREARGQHRIESAESTSADAREPNKWERQYLRESSGDGGYWTREYASEQDCTHDYRGFLEMLLQTGDMTATEYLDELQRLRSEGLEREQCAVQWAGTGAHNGQSKGDRLRPERFRKDTRSNSLSA